MRPEPYDVKQDDKAERLAQQCRSQCAGSCMKGRQRVCKYLYHQVDCPQFEPPTRPKFTGYRS